MVARPSTLVIRADADEEIGSGHIMRCIALAEAWADLFGPAELVSATLLPWLEARVSATFRSVHLLRQEIGSEADAAETRELCRARKASCLYVDGYGFDDAYLRSLQGPWALGAADDLAQDRPWPVEVVLNQNLHALQLADDHYGGAAALRGPHYALLRREFRSREKIRGRCFERPHVLVTFGATDPTGLTERVAEILRVEGVERVTLLPGGGSERAERLRTRFEPPFEVLGHIDGMPELLDRVDVAIGAGGSTTWELCRFGVPSVLVPFAENQIEVARAIAQCGAGIMLGDGAGNLDPTAISALVHFLADRDRLRGASEAAARLVDGKGALRVARTLYESGSESS